MSDRAQSAKIPFRVKSPEPMNKPERVQSPKPQPLQRQLKSPEPPPPSRGSIKSPEPPRFPVRNADPLKTPERFKSPEPAQMSPEPVLNGDNKNSFSTSNGVHNSPDTTPSSFSSQQESAEDQGLSRKKVVRVVKKVVRRVVPTEEEAAAAVKELHKRTSAAEKPKPAEPVSKPERTPLFSFKHDGIKEEPAKDDMAAGLASLMSRAKTKEHRARFRGPERRQGEQEASPEPQQQEQTAEPQEEEKPQRKAEPTAEKEKEELSVTPPPPKIEDKLSLSSPRPCPSNPQSTLPAVLAASKPEVYTTTELHFNHFAENSAFGIAPLSKPDEKQKASQQFTKLQAAMKVLGIASEEQRAIWLVLGAIYHLGAAGATKVKPLCNQSLISTPVSHLSRICNVLVCRALKSSQHSLCSIMVVDTPGFQNPRIARQDRGATFEELCHNYTQERLQTLFHEHTFVQELERYKEENIELALDDLESSTSLSVAAVDQASHQALNTLFSTFVSSVLSSGKNISCLFMGRTGSATVLSGSIAGLEGSSQLVLRRATSMRKTFTTGVAAVKKKSLCIQIKLQVDALIDTVKKSKLHFVHCLLPKADALSSDVRLSSGGPSPKAGEGEPHGENCDSGLMQLDVSLLRAQLRGSKLLDALRIYRQGYPDHMVFSEFRRRFDVLAPHLTKKHGRNYIVTDEKRAAEELLESLDLENSSYHMGLSRVFFRAGTLAKLEEQRDEQTRRNISLFQGVCRGYMARQSFKKRKLFCGEWRLKYDRAIREIDFTKKRLQQEFDDKLEVEQQNKRQLERRLTDLQADSEESQRTVQQLKKKCQRLTSELQDTKLHLEGQQGRNHELEKKQRKEGASETSQLHTVQTLGEARSSFSSWLGLVATPVVCFFILDAEKHWWKVHRLTTPILLKLTDWVLEILLKFLLILVF
ncbi:UNVERIFIED_CONTAM: hypothetical protein FKN15_075066 [Acipenser sinensis]